MSGFLKGLSGKLRDAGFKQNNNKGKVDLLNPSSIKNLTPKEIANDVFVAPQKRKLDRKLQAMVFKWSFIAVVLLIAFSFLYNFAFKDDFNAQELTQEEIDSAKRKFYGIVFLYITWSLVGIAAFIMSLICFGRNGSFISKLGGLILSIFFGPFYWFYYAFNKTYCVK